jgi:hypothetical protein
MKLEKLVEQTFKEMGITERDLWLEHFEVYREYIDRDFSLFTKPHQGHRYNANGAGTAVRKMRRMVG